MADLPPVASWLLLPPPPQSNPEVWEDTSVTVDDVGLGKEGSLPACFGGRPWSGPNVQADSTEVQQLLTDHRALLADFAKLRADVDVIVGCMERHGITVPLRHRCGSDGKASAPGTSLESVAARPKVASRVFAAAGQVGWSAALQLSRSLRSSARSVQEEKVLVVGGMDMHGGHERSTATVAAFDLQRRTWQPVPPLPHPRSCHALGVIGGYVYVCGGLGMPARSVMSFSPASQQWVALASMRKPRAWAGAVVLNRGLYVAGGATAATVWESIECLHPNGLSHTTTWSIVPGRMQTARRTFAAVALQGKIFMCGGCEQPMSSETTPDACSATAEVFSLTTGISHSIASMRTPRIFHTASVIGNKVIATGGAIPGTSCALRSTELYSPEQDHWHSCPDWAMPFPRGGHGTLAIGGRLLIMGGNDQDVKGEPGLASVQCLDLASGMWEVLEPMPEGRSAFTSGLIACGPTSEI